LTVNVIVLLACPATVIITFPVVAPEGTWTVMLLHCCPVGQGGSGIGNGGALHIITARGVPLSATQVWPAVQFIDGALPKLVPVMTNPICKGPCVSEMPLM